LDYIITIIAYDLEPTLGAKHEYAPYVGFFVVYTVWLFCARNIIWCDVFGALAYVVESVNGR